MTPMKRIKLLITVYGLYFSLFQPSTFCQTETTDLILYCRPILAEIINEWGMRVMLSDGASQVELAKGPYVTPKISRDGNILVFAGPHPRVSEVLTLYSIQTTGGNPTLLTPAVGMQYDPTFSPDKTRVAYHVYIPKGGGEPEPTKNPNPNDPNEPNDPDPNEPNRFLPYTPPFSDATYYYQKRIKTTQINPIPSDNYIAIARVDGSDESSIFPIAIPNQGMFQAWKSPDWHPIDENKILASMQELYSFPGAALFLISPDGINRQLLFPPYSSSTIWENDDYPVWSPDGQYIAYSRQIFNVTNFSSVYSIFLMRGDASDAPGTQITPDFYNNLVTDGISHIDWSPDGEWITFSAATQMSLDIYKIRKDGRDMAKLTNDGISVYPCWCSLPSDRIGPLNVPDLATPTPTATQNQPGLPTMTPTATPTLSTPSFTPTSTGSIPNENGTIALYEFDQLDLAACGWKEIPGGFTGSDPGQIFTNTFVGGLIPSSLDQVGIRLTVDSNQVVFIHAAESLSTDGSPVLIRLTARASAPNAALALAALKGNLRTNDEVDGSIAAAIPSNIEKIVDHEYRLVIIYEPDNSDLFTPIVQVANNGETPVNVFIDKLEVIQLPPNESYYGSEFGALSSSGLAGNELPSEPDQVYEFDQMNLEQCGWKEIPGGFTEASAGQISNNIYVGKLIPSSRDEVGMRLTVNPNQVSFIHSFNPIETHGFPLLIRATVRADASKAAVALAALKGNLSTGEGVDGSISTHIPASAASMISNERQLTLVFPSNSAGVVTPILQIASNAQEGTVHVFIDRLEIYRLDDQTVYSGSMFNSISEDNDQAAIKTPTPVIQSPSPTSISIIPTPTPILIIPTPTNTRPPTGPIQEQEPNDSQAQPQALGTLVQGGSIQVNGRMSSGGFQGEQYIGDADGFSFTLSSPSAILFSLSWNTNADLDFFLFSGGRQIAQQSDYNNPAILETNLGAGTYIILIISADSTADYILTMSSG